MFTNIGRKIKGLAKTICWIGIIFGILYGLVLAGAITASAAAADVVIVGVILGLLAGALVAGLLALLSWLGSLTLYGYGELIDRTATIDQTTIQTRYELQQQSKQLSSIAEKLDACRKQDNPTAE